MNQWYTINGKTPLQGTVTISGAKNAAVAIIPAAILAGEACVLENLPIIQDVNTLKQILANIGANVSLNDNGTMKVDGSTIKSTSITFEMVSSLRASYYLLGAMLAKCGHAELALPGGCDIGKRPIDQHIKAMEALGATVRIEKGILKAHANKLVGAEIYFDIVSVGSTINAMMAAVTAQGQTIITNAAKEPHVVDVANFLNTMGARVRGAGTDEIRINGVKKLHGCSYAIIPDQIEAGTFMIAAAATGGDVYIRNVIPTHLEAISAKLMESGARVIEGDNGSEFYIQVTGCERPRGINIKTLPYPGFPTDLQQPMMAYLSRCNGNSFIVENIFEDRFNHVAELERMGARIELNSRTAMIEGVRELSGAPLYVSDLRAGASLVVAALCAHGESTIHNIDYIDRGYEKFEHKLSALKADIKRNIGT